jgi:coenzyme F420-reducing hydrogenase delta subunit/Pyruvate/2-oxoacid:ferredoxin oxidoreductase delta subunit
LTSPTLIIGSGACAREVARHLRFEGRPTIIAAANGTNGDRLHRGTDTRGSGSNEVLTGARLSACRGFLGHFDATLTQSGATLQRRVAHIVIAEDNRRIPNFDLYRLRAGSVVQSLSTFKKEFAMRPEAFANSRVVFLHGLRLESEPVLAEEVFRCALELQAVSGAQAHVLTGNLKVAGDGLEALYRDAKSAGTLFFKFTDTQPTIQQTESGPVSIEFQDEITGHDYHLSPDITVVDECIVPAAYVEHLATVLGLRCGPAGFLQTENVHRLPVFTNRRGILAVGPARAVLSPAEVEREAACAARAIFGFTNLEGRPQVATAEIDPGRCIRCLTCFRLCPYGAVDKGDRIAVVTDACAGCGICVAECPRGAIQLGSNGTMIEKEDDAISSSETSAPDPHMVVFACARSADKARELAESHGQQSASDQKSDLKVVTVPCAGAVSVQHILSAFAGGAAGVMVLACHVDNCHSETGNLHARRRVDYLVDHLDRMGFGGDRLEMATLAANMPSEYADMTRRFSRKIQKRANQR